MDKFKEALKHGKVVRNLQDEVLTLFLVQMQEIEDIETLQGIKKQLKGEVK